MVKDASKLHLRYTSTRGDPRRQSAAPDVEVAVSVQVNQSRGHRRWHPHQLKLRELVRRSLATGTNDVVAVVVVVVLFQFDSHARVLGCHTELE
jgi:hypothetical protein